MLAAALLLCLAQEPSLEELIRRLDSDTLAERDDAQKKLKARGRAALPLLEKAAQRADPEVAARAKRLVELVKLAEREKLTPEILADLPGIDEKLLSLGNDAWVRAYLEPAGAIPAAARSFLAPRAAKQARTVEDRLKICQSLARSPIPEAAPDLVPYFLSPVGEFSDPDELLKEAVQALVQMKARRELFRVVTEYGIHSSERRYTNPNISSEAFRGLVRLKAREEILQIARTPDSACSGDAARALGEMKGADIDAELLQLLSSKAPWVRHHAALALGKRGVKEARPALSAMLSDPDGPPLRAAAEALARLGSREDIPRILPLVHDDRSWVQVTAMRSLCLLDAKEALPALQDVLTHRDPAVRAVAGESLASLRGREAIPELLPMLKDPEAVVRLYVAVALGRAGGAETVPVLIRLAEKEEQVYLNVGDRLSGGGFEMPPRALLALNGVRSPEIWSRLRELRLSREAWGTVLPDLDGFAKDAGLALSLSPELELVKATFPKRQYYAVPIPEGTPLLDALGSFSLSTRFEILFDGPAFRVLTRPEALAAWKTWYISREPSTPEAAAFKAELVRAAMAPAERAALEAREKDEAKAKHRQERAQALEGVWTPGLKAKFEERLLDGDEKTWAEIALEIQGKSGAAKTLDPADLEVLVLRGQQAAAKPEDRVKILTLAQGAAGKPLEELLLRLLKDPEYLVRASAANLLDSKAHERELLALAADPAPGVRKVVADRLLDQHPRECLEIYRELSLSPDWHLSDWATMRLQYRAGPDFISHMIGQLGRSTQNFGAAHCALGYLGRQGAREAIPQILALLDQDRSPCLPQAMQALLELGAKDSLPRILGVARKNPAAFAPAAPLIEVFGVTEARPGLYALLEGDEPYSPHVILLTLARMGDRDSLSTIRRFLHHRSSTTRDGACEALALLEGPAARKEILEVLKDPDSTPYRALVRSEARETIPRLRNRMTTEGNVLIRPLVDLGAREALPEIFEILDKPATTSYFVESLKAAARAYPRESIPTLRINLESKTGGTSTHAASLLCEAGSAEGVPALLEARRPTFSLNALRKPEAWRTLYERKIDRTLYGPGSKLLDLVAREAGLKLEDLPASAVDIKAWTGHHYFLPQGPRALRLIEIIESLEDPRWAFILQQDSLRVVPHEEALRFWKDWWASKK